MSFFSWLFPANRTHKAPPAESSGLSRMDATRPVTPQARAAAGQREPVVTSNAQPANRKHERMARRELLYAVVRECMLRSGVLSSAYKFKVLSLDARGRQFMVMVDLSRQHAGETSRLAEIEAQIAQGAKSRHDVIVTAVYWRMNEHVATGNTGPTGPTASTAAQAPRATPSRPAPLMPAVATDAGIAVPDQVVLPSPVPAGAPAGRRFEPIRNDEVLAFREALAAGLAKPAASAAPVADNPQFEKTQPVFAIGAAMAAAATGAATVATGASARAFDGSGQHGPQSYTLLTGFEDTEMPDGEGRSPALSATQYGELT